MRYPTSITKTDAVVELLEQGAKYFYHEEKKRWYGFIFRGTEYKTTRAKLERAVGRLLHRGFHQVDLPERSAYDTSVMQMVTS